MYHNEGYPSNIVPLTPHGTNSTMFTDCCEVAICNGQQCCPRCGRPVVGDNEESHHRREIVRWSNATRFWKR